MTVWLSPIIVMRNDFRFQVVKFQMGCQSSTIEKHKSRERDLVLTAGAGFP